MPLTSPGGLLGGGAALADAALTVTGDVAGLVPGGTAPLLLHVHNGGDEPVVVTALPVRVTGGRDGCRPNALTVEQWTGRLTVPAHATSDHAVAVQVSPDGGCTDVKWTLHYRAVTG